VLIDTQPLYDEVVALATRIDARWREILLPGQLKREFGQLWATGVGHPAELATGQTRLFTSPERFEYVPDVALAKAICAYPLRKALHEYRSIAFELAQVNQITSFRDEHREASNTRPRSWALWVQAIAHSNLSADEKQRFERFLSDSRSFHEIKGIARGDFATPAIVKALGQRVERFGIADEIARVANDSLYQSVRSIVVAPSPSANTDGGNLRNVFMAALAEAGFHS
jgi:hypothetical protein